jgi:uncharacterized protein (TIGR00251 family)
MARQIAIASRAAGLIFSCRIVPNSKFTGFMEILADGAVKIKITSRAVDLKANRELIEFLSRSLDVSETQFDIIKGQRYRYKTLLLREASLNEIKKKFKSLVS